MRKVVDLQLVKNDRQPTQQEAWEQFVDAMNRSKETLRFEDGIAAGKAYRKFVELFDRPSHGRR